MAVGADGAVTGFGSEDLQVWLGLVVRSLLANDVWRAEATAVLLRRIDELVGPGHR